MHRKQTNLMTLARTLLFAFVLPAAAGSQAQECDGRFFVLDPDGNELSSAHPAPSLAAAMRKANAGDPAAQRSLAIAYQTGYLVSRCRERAAYWYGKAAAGGDEAAKRWQKEEQEREALRAGPECNDGGCRNNGPGEGSAATLYSDAARHHHYFAPVTINGKTLVGMIDTGASNIGMSADAARHFGIDTSGGVSGRSSTANGIITTTLVVLPRIDIAGVTLRNVSASIGISDGILIGMSFLHRLNISISGGTLRMSKR